MKVTQLCPTLWDPMDYTVHGILQARILEWIAFPSPGYLPNPRIEPRIIDKYDPVAIYFIVLGLSLYTLFVFPV